MPPFHRGESDKEQLPMRAAANDKNDKNEREAATSRSPGGTPPWMSRDGPSDRGKKEDSKLGDKDKMIEISESPERSEEARKDKSDKAPAGYGARGEKNSSKGEKRGSSPPRSGKDAGQKSKRARSGDRDRDRDRQRDGRGGRDSGRDKNDRDRDRRDRRRRDGPDRSRSRSRSRRRRRRSGSGGRDGGRDGAEQRLRDALQRDRDRERERERERERARERERDRERAGGARRRRSGSRHSDHSDGKKEKRKDDDERKKEEVNSQKEVKVKEEKKEEKPAPEDPAWPDDLMDSEGCKLVMGQKVELKGLREPELNGKRGIIFGHRQGYVGVQMSDGKRQGFRPKNLRRAGLSPSMPERGGEPQKEVKVKEEKKPEKKPEPEPPRNPLFGPSSVDQQQSKPAVVPQATATATATATAHMATATATATPRPAVAPVPAAAGYPPAGSGYPHPAAAAAAPGGHVSSTGMIFGPAPAYPPGMRGVDEVIATHKGPPLTNEQLRQNADSNKRAGPPLPERKSRSPDRKKWATVEYKPDGSTGKRDPADMRAKDLVKAELTGPPDDSKEAELLRRMDRKVVERKPASMPASDDDDDRDMSSPEAHGIPPEVRKIWLKMPDLLCVDHDNMPPAWDSDDSDVVCVDEEAGGGGKCIACKKQLSSKDGEREAAKEGTRGRLERLFRRYCPAKLANVPHALALCHKQKGEYHTALTAAAHSEELLFQRLVKEYGPEPPTPWAQGSGGAAGEWRVGDRVADTFTGRNVQGATISRVNSDGTYDIKIAGCGKFTREKNIKHFTHGEAVTGACGCRFCLPCASVTIGGSTGGEGVCPGCRAALRFPSVTDHRLRAARMRKMQDGGEAITIVPQEAPRRRREKTAAAAAAAQTTADQVAAAVNKPTALPVAAPVPRQPHTGWAAQAHPAPYQPWGPPPVAAPGAWGGQQYGQYAQYGQYGAVGAYGQQKGGWGQAAVARVPGQPVSWGTTATPIQSVPECMQAGWGSSGPAAAPSGGGVAGAAAAAAAAARKPEVKDIAGRGSGLPVAMPHHAGAGMPPQGLPTKIPPGGAAPGTPPKAGTPPGIPPGITHTKVPPAAGAPPPGALAAAGAKPGVPQYVAGSAPGTPTGFTM